MVKVATSETNPDGKPGNYFEKPCGILAVIESVENFEHDSNQPRIEVKFKSLASTEPDQVGKERVERFNLSGKAIGRFLELACAVGCYSKPQWKADHEAGVDPEIDENQFVGLLFCTNIAMKPANKPQPGKEGMLFPDIGFNIWAIGDEEADHIPIPAEIMAEFKDGLPTKQGTLRKRPAPGGKPGPAGGAKPATGTKPAPVKPSGGAAGAQSATAAAGGDLF